MHKIKCTALDISVIGIIFNTSLSVMKILAGIFGKSYALVLLGVLFGVAGGHFGYPVIDKVVCERFNCFIAGKFEKKSSCMSFESSLRMFGGKYIAEIYFSSHFEKVAC